MTDILDQYERASQKSKNANNTIKPEMGTSGYIQMKLYEETPMFSKQKFSFNPTDRITHLVVSNDYLVLAMANCTMFRIDLKHPENHDEITFGKAQLSPLTNLFLDPLGRHLLAAFAPASNEATGSPDLLYLQRNNAKLRATTKFRNHVITAIAWNNANVSETCTGPILLGTSKGLIFETEIGLDGDKLFQTSIEQYWKQLFDIGKGSAIAITGIEFRRLPNADRYFVIVTTPNRLYQFIGNANADEKPLLQQIFTSYLNVEEKFENITSNINYSRLCFSHHPPKSMPKSMAWLTGLGIFFEEVNPYGKENIVSINENSVLKFPKESTDARIPSNFVLTNFHALLLYEDTIRGISTLNKELVFEDNYTEKLVNIVKDAVKGTIWAFTERCVYRYKISQEERNVWQIYCDKKQYELAKTYSKDNAANFDKVLVKEAENWFDQTEYEKSAQIYADTQASFEQICLKFLKINEMMALKVFLRRKLERLTVNDITQVTLIVLWVIELYLNELGRLRNESGEESGRCKDLRMGFEEFLETPVVSACVDRNKRVVYNLMASHGDQYHLLKLTIANRDFEGVIRQYIYKGNYEKALGILKSQHNRELLYQFAPILMQEIPELTVEALTHWRNLSPIKLLPAIVGCEQDKQHMTEILRYLEHCVFVLNAKERAIHNYLLALYAQHSFDKKLNDYLAMQGQDSNTVFYDVHYALRLCQQHGLIEACVTLSGILGLWESAVDLALTKNIELAKTTANIPQNDDDLKKKLWLKIAKHVVDHKKDIKTAMQFLQECDLIKIEDVLPFFPNFKTIDHFKTSICASLQEYNQHIRELKEEMEEATKAADVVREEIQQFRNRCRIIGTEDICSICKLELLSRPIRPFYSFPCNHKFHEDCLLSELTPILGPAKQYKLIDLHRQLSTLGANADNVSTNSVSLSSKDLIRADIDNIVASDCLYCGEHMISNIDASFGQDTKFY